MPDKDDDTSSYEEEEEEEEEDEEDEEFQDSPAKPPNTSVKGGADEDDEFNFDSAPQPKKLANDTHDEAMSVGDDASEHVPTPTKDKPSAAPAPSAAPVASKKLSNDAHDEAVSVDGEDEDSEDLPTPTKGKPAAAAAAAAPKKAAGAAPAAGTRKVQNTAHDEEMSVSGSDVTSDDDDEDDDDDDDGHDAMESTLPQSSPVKAAPAPLGGGKDAPSSPTVAKKIGALVKPGSKQRDSDDEGSTSEEDEAPQPPPAALEYNPAEYANLKVSKDVKELFSHIVAFAPHAMELETRLKPCVPDYIPAVGDIDTFIKVPRPDTKADSLGLTVLDEPAAQQSNPAVVKIGLMYSSTSNRAVKADQVVDSIEDARHKPAQVDKWIADVAALHRKKPAVTVNYKKPMPDVEELLQVWPSDFEDLLSSSPDLPGAELDVPLHQYVQFVCAILDIPVYDSIIESLHVLFNVYSEFKSNQHFSHHVEM